MLISLIQNAPAAISIASIKKKFHFWLVSPISKEICGWTVSVMLYTLFQNGYHFSILLLVFKLALLASFLSSKIKRIFYLERGKKG